MTGTTHTGMMAPLIISRRTTSSPSYLRPETQQPTNQMIIDSMLNTNWFTQKRETGNICYETKYTTSMMNGIIAITWKWLVVENAKIITKSFEKLNLSPSDLHQSSNLQLLPEFPQCNVVLARRRWSWKVLRGKFLILQH